MTSSVTKSATSVSVARLDKATLAYSHRFADFLVRLVWAYPVIWAIGLGGACIPLLALPSLLFLFQIRLPRTSQLALLLAVSILLSSIIGVASFGAQFERLLFMMGNVAVWVVLAAALAAATVVDFRARLLKALIWVISVQAALIAAAMLIYPSKLPIPLLSQISGRLPSGLAAFARSDLYFVSWLGRIAYRSSGLMGNPTWMGVLAAGVLILVLMGKPEWEIGIRLKLVALFSCGLALYLSLSRSTYIALGVAVLAGLLLRLRSKSSPLFLTTVCLGLPTILVVGLANVGKFQQFLEYLDETRSGSSASRTAIYERTWSYIQELPFPFLGYGLKPQEDGLVASVATHSTYLGLLFRCGLVGLALFAMLFISLLRNAIRSKETAGFAISALVLTWSALEDFDGGHMLPLVLIFAVSPSAAGVLSDTLGSRLAVPTSRSWPPNAQRTTK